MSHIIRQSKKFVRIILKCLTNARVPIIKFKKIHVDISFNRSSGKIIPSLGKLVIVAKWLLNHHKLDDPFVGGIGGYNAFCLMLSLHVRLRILFLFCLF